MERQSKMRLRANRSWAFPRSTAACGLGPKSGSPQTWSWDRMVHQEDPGGPWRAWLQELHGRAIQTAAQIPPRIQPLRTWRTTGRSRLNHGFTAKSIGSAAVLRRRMDAERRPEPANSSRTRVRGAPFWRLKLWRSSLRRCRRIESFEGLPSPAFASSTARARSAAARGPARRSGRSLGAPRPSPGRRRRRDGRRAAAR